MSYEAYANTLTAVVATFATRMGPLLRLFMSSDRGDKARRDFIAIGAPLIRQERQRVYDQAVMFSTEEASRSGVKLSDWATPELSGYPDEALGAVLDRIKEADVPTATMAAAKALERHVRAPAREFVQELADPSPVNDVEIFQGDTRADFSDDVLLTEEERAAFQAIIEAKDEETPEERKARYEAAWAEEKANRRERRLARRRGDLPEPGEVIPRRRWKYARVLTGRDNCAFCVMLASRGPVYSSAKRAAGLDEIVPIKDGDTKIRAKAMERIEQIGDKYHDDCDCIAVPVFLDADYLAQGMTDKLQEIWKEAQKLEAKTEKGDHPLNLLRNYLAAEKPTIPNLREGLTLAA